MINLGEVDQGWEVFNREEARLGGNDGSLRLADSGFVEGTDFLADVAAKDPAIGLNG